MIRVIFEEPVSKHILNGEIPKIKNQAKRIPALIAFIQHCTKDPSQGNKPNKRGHRD